MHSSLRFARLENACTHAVLVRVRVKCRTVILGSLAEAWHCSREYRVERRLPGASSHTYESLSSLRPRSILALVYVCLSFFYSLSYSYYFSSNVTSSCLFLISEFSLLFFSLKLVPSFHFSFCFFLPWLLKLSSSLHSFLFAIYWFLFFVLALLFLTHYIFKCISLCSCIYLRRRNFSHTQYNKFLFFLFSFYLTLIYFYIHLLLCISHFYLYL